MQELHSRRDKFSRVVGRPVHVQIEFNEDELRIDHVWITLEVVQWGPVRAAINTLSHLNRIAGFDERVRLGIVRENYETLPVSGIFPCKRFDYAEIEKTANVFYEHLSRPEMERFLIDRGSRAVLAEVWGDIYTLNHLGVHQVHSRRASCAVPHDFVGRDGALKFYFEPEKTCELLLFKFCGQP